MLALFYCQKEISISFYFDIKHNLYSYKGERNMYTYEHKVQYYETDKMGITHHSNYIRWMEEARVAFLNAKGLSYAYCEQRGIISPVVGVSTRYKRPTTFDETIRIEISIKEYSGFRLIFNYVMKNKDDVIVCTAESEHAFLTTQGKVTILKQSFPDVDALLTSLVEQ